jgi:hypothetical protein
MFNWIGIWVIVENFITWIGPAAALGAFIALAYWVCSWFIGD